MGVFDSVEERLWLNMGLLQNGYRVWTWCFSDKKELFYTSCPYDEQLKYLFLRNEIVDYIFTECKDVRQPFFVNDEMDLVWIGEFFDRKEGSEVAFCLIGPIFTAKTSLRHINDLLHKRDISVKLRSRFMRIYEEIPVLPVHAFLNMGKMLHYAITCQDSEDVEILFPKVEKEKEEKQENEIEISEGMDSDLNYERAENREKLLLQCVRDGNRNYEEYLSSLLPGNTDALQTGNTLRTSKDVVIIFTSQCTQAAIEGGVPQKAAREKEWYYIRKIEEQDSITKLYRLNREMLDDFIDLVNETDSLLEVSAPVKQCIAFMKQHYAEPITLEQIAKMTGYTEYYITRKFQNEMGIKLLDYLKDIRLNYAKIWLTTTNRSIQDISDTLQFGTRNYFTKVFKERTGITPNEYRARTGRANDQ